MRMNARGELMISGDFMLELDHVSEVGDSYVNHTFEFFRKSQHSDAVGRMHDPRVLKATLYRLRYLSHAPNGTDWVPIDSTDYTNGKAIR